MADQIIANWTKKYMTKLPWHIDFTTTPEQDKLRSPREKRILFGLKRVSWRLFAIGGPLFLGFCAFQFGKDIIPRFHISAIKKSYEDRETTHTVSGRKSAIQGCIAKWIRNTSSSPIKFSKELSNKDSFLYSSPIQDKQLLYSSLSRTHLCQPACFSETRCRFFHAKQDEPAESVVPEKRSRQQEKKKPNDNETENIFTNLFKHGLKTLLFGAGCFGLAGIWKANQRANYDIDNLVTKFRESLRDHNTGVEISGYLSRYDIALFGIIATNILVFVLWKFASLRSSMLKWFTVSISTTSRTSIPFLLSSFSHSSFLHLFINMYILRSFSKAWEHYSYRCRDQMPKGLMGPDTFLAFFLTAGAVSGLGSYVLKLVSSLYAPSLGASGAIMALLGYVCYKLPDSRLSIVFLPTWTFTAESALKGIIAFDTLGLCLGALTRWRYYVLDHAGHLAGMFFGIWYAKYGEEALYKWSRWVAKQTEKYIK